MHNLLKLQELDLKIQERRAKEHEIPKQKQQFDAHRARIHEQLEKEQEDIKALQLEQRVCEKDIEQHEATILKYKSQLPQVKKNEEYQALLHEIELEKKKISQRETRQLEIMEEIEAAQAKFAEDRKTLDAELQRIDEECAKIDAQLQAANSRLSARRWKPIASRRC